MGEGEGGGDGWTLLGKKRGEGEGGLQMRDYSVTSHHEQAPAAAAAAAAAAACDIHSEWGR